MNDIPKLLIFTGLFLVLFGIVWIFGGKYFSFGRLPGDIVIEKGNLKIYAPLVTSLIISIILSLFFWILFYFRR